LYRRGEVYYANLPFYGGHEQAGNRPVVVLQNDKGNAYSPTLIIAPITSQKKKNLPTHVCIGENQNLSPDSIALLEQIVVLDKSRMGNFVCTLDERAMERIEEALKVSLGLKGGDEKVNEIIHIGNSDIAVKEYKGQRVVTFKDIDTVHGRPDGTARRNFNTNKKRFIEGEDYFLVGSDEIRTSRLFPISDNDYMEKTLITEQGYLMLVKSFTDDLAWEVQRQLVNGYFRAKKLSQVEMMRIQLGMIDDHENRIANLESNMTIDYGQQQVLGDTVNKTVIEALGGKGSNAYREISKKVFAECNRDLKHYFNVNARNNVPKKKFDEAVEYAKNWKPCTNTVMLIDEHNAQITF